jgi:Histidine kinase-, DNA gyrase B-, and HSP90-like ATPase
MTVPPVDPRRIDASPTKEFFISMLIKDVDLIPAIIDLVDNSLDGARRLRQGADATYKGLQIEVSARDGRFEIKDNCGGFDVETARNYAFRFGRPSGMPTTQRSVGQFGVGMKRALFKLGTAFHIESTTRTTRFSVTVDVQKWAAAKDWDFRFDSDPEEGIRVPVADTGTLVRLTHLHPGVREEFQSPNFAARLRDEIEKRHSKNIVHGLEINVNGRSLSSAEPQLLLSNDLRPAFEAHRLTSNGHGPVHVDLYAGVAQSSPSDAGWYVYCNDRLVIKADQSNVTGWGETGNTRIPRFHNQFADFRGYVFFEADDAAALPWNTTKTGVEFEHPVFRSTRVRMVQMMRPVIDFLNKIKEEAEGQRDPGPLSRTLKAARLVKLSKLTRGQFHYKPARASKPPGNAYIQYSRPIAQIERAKDQLGVTTNREVGEKSFDYFYKTVCTD